MATKAERKDKDTESYYSKVKQENAELKEKVGWLDNDSFLLDQDVDVRQAYIYLRKNPESAKFIFRKYKSLQPIIKELCDPENPLYLDGVKTALAEIVDIQSDKENAEQLKEQIKKENHEIQLLKQEIEQAKTEYDTTYENLERIRKESDEYNKQRSNIRTDAGLELIQKNSKDVMEFLTAILGKWDLYFKEHPTSLGMQLDKSELNHMDLLNRNLKDMAERIHSDDFLSPENLDAYHKELLEKIKAEKENSLHEMDAFMSYNPKKVLAKILDNTANAMKKIENSQDDGAGGMYLNKFTAGFVKGNLLEGMKYLNNLMDQVENKERRSK